MDGAHYFDNEYIGEKMTEDNIVDLVAWRNDKAHVQMMMEILLDQQDFIDEWMGIVDQICAEAMGLT